MSPILAIHLSIQSSLGQQPLSLTLLLALTMRVLVGLFRLCHQLVLTIEIACPALNTLANHGYINHNGSDIERQSIIDALLAQQVFLQRRGQNHC